MIYVKIILLLLFAFQVQAKPLYEIGLAVGGGYIPDYDGSEQGRNRSIAVPTFIYRGDVLKNDRRGTRALFLKLENWDFDFSFGASFPLESEKNDARRGMDDLDWQFEAGPRATYFFYKSDQRILSLEFPIRFVLSTDFDFTKDQGQRFIPQLDYRENLGHNWRFGLSYKLNYGTEALNDYIYEVKSRDVTADRERFNAKGGFISQDFSTSLVYRTEKFVGIVGYRYSLYDNATNWDSPLLKVHENSAIFMAFNYFFFQSTQQGKFDKSGEY